MQEGEVTLELVMWEEKYSNDGRANKMQGMKRSNSDTCSVLLEHQTGKALENTQLHVAEELVCQNPLI